jgi:hypothetical protein
MQVSFLFATHNIRCTSMLDVCRLEFALFMMLNQMYKNILSSIILDKTILNELVNENVKLFYISY